MMLAANNFELFDYLISNVLILVVAIPTLFVIFYFVFFKRLFSHLFKATSVFNKIQYVLPALIVIPAVLTVPILGICAEEYGYADNAPQIFASDNSTVYVLSTMDHTGRSTYTVHRLHYFDKNTGKEYERSLLPRDFHKRNWKLIDNILWIDNPRYKKVDGINLSDGNKRTIDVDHLETMDEQSKKIGINSFEVDFATNKIKVVRNDGSDTILDPFTTNKKSEIIFRYEEDKTITNFPPDFQFTLTGENQKILFLNDGVILGNENSIDGLILANLPEEKLFVLFGYDNMDHDNIAMECINYEVKQQWVLSSAELPPGEVNDFYQDGEKLYVIIGGTLVVVDIVKGKVLWRDGM